MKMVINFCSLLLVTLFYLHVTEVYTKDVIDNEKGLYGDDFGDQNELKKPLESIATSLTWLKRLPRIANAIELLPKRIAKSLNGLKGMSSSQHF